jgi:PleD family two-component response regulator
MLGRYVNLQELDDGRNIMTLPIKAGSRVWGVLDIEAMPFARYNLYTERLLQVIMDLVSPALEHAVDSETALAATEMDKHTGLPTYPQFHAILEKDLYRAEIQHGSLSVIILEIANADDIRMEYGNEKYYSFLVRFVENLRKFTQGKADLFHYRAEHQLALLYPNLDFDGASLSCLEILSMVTSTEWTINDKPLSVDAVIGYASHGEKKQKADELLDGAEHLLEMQKV